MTFSRGIPLIVLAGLAGVVASFTIHRYVTVRTRVPVKASSKVVVATADISPGMAVADGLVKIVSWPQDLIPPNAAASLQELKDRVIKTPVAKGEPILFSKLAPEGTVAGLSGLLREDKRALAIRVDDVAGVAGFVHPGNHVDVLVEMAVPNSQEHISKTFLQDIVVLTIGQIWEQKGDSKPVLVNTVTLELTPPQAEMLNLASNQGKIRLALRNPTNLAAAPTKGVNISQLIDEQSRRKGPPKKVPSVEVIKGMERTEVPL